MDAVPLAGAAPVSRRARFRVVARLDMASRATPGTVTIDRSAGGTFAVRPLRRRREYVLPLATVAELVVRSIIVAEVRAKRAERRGGREVKLSRNDKLT